MALDRRVAGNQPAGGDYTDRVDQRAREDLMGSKDKGGANTKKKAQHNLKEKREAKKAKKTTSK
jgi:hypothetical protein